MRTNNRSWVGCALALVLASTSEPARAGPGPVLADSQQRAALVWQPLAVRYPVAVDAGGSPTAAAAELVPTVPSGPLLVGPRVGVDVRLAALAVARVRVIGSGTLRFRRVTGAPGEGQAVTTEEPTELSPGTWLLEQPPGGTSDWLVSAPQDTRVVIEGVVPRTGDLIWEHAIGAALTWIDEGGPTPQLPEVTGAEEARQELLADGEIAAALRGGDPRDGALARAVRGWQAAAAIQRIEALRDPVRAAFALELGPRRLTGAAAVDGAPGWQRVRGAKSHELELRGPGVLWIEARSVGVGGSLRVLADGRVLAEATLRPPAPDPGERRGAAAVEGISAAPRVVRRGEDVDVGAPPVRAPALPLGPRLAAAVGGAVGPPAELRVALPPGSHTLRLVFSGPDTLVTLRAARSNQRMAAALRGESVKPLLRRAHRALRRSESAHAPLLAALLASVAGEAQPGVGPPATNPRLALAQTLLRAQAAYLTPAERLALARTLADQATQAKEGPLVWRARRVGLDLIAGAEQPALALALAGPHPAEAPNPVLERLAGEIGGPALALRSPALALLEMARRRAPLDPALRAVYRDLWRSDTRWAALRVDDTSGAGWTWIEPQPAADERVPGARALWRWPSGQPQVVEAKRPPGVGRTALLRLYADMRAWSGAVTMRVGEQRWTAPSLGGVERWQLALPPGRHQVEVIAPAGAALWSSRPPTSERPPDGHLLRLWPLSAGESVRFVLPGGESPAFVRIELRALVDDRGAATSQRARVWIARDDEPERAVDLTLEPVDPEVVPVHAQSRVGRRTNVVVRVDPKHRSVRVRVDTGAPQIAVGGAIRATRDSSSEATGDAIVAQEEGPQEADAEDLDDANDVRLARLASLSQAVRKQPGDLSLRVARAELLLDLDQADYAFVDWAVVAGSGLPRQLQAPALALAERLDALDTPDTIDISATQPTLVAPALAAAIGGDVARLNALQPVATAARSGGPAAGLMALKRLAIVAVPTDSRDTAAVAAAADTNGLAAAAGVLQATLLDAKGDADAAAQLWTEIEARHGLWQAGLMGVHSFLAALDGEQARPGSLLRRSDGAPRADGAALAYGLALAVRRTVRTPAVERLAVVAGTRSLWSTVSNSERDGGIERLQVPRAPSVPGTNAAVRQALLSPPWPHADGTLVRPGHATVLTIQRKRTLAISVDLWCETVRPDHGTGPADVQVSLDDAPLLRGPVAAGALRATRIEALPPGRHRVEVTLAAASKGQLCSVRLRDEDAAIASMKPTVWEVTRPGQPVEVFVLGPTTLIVEARALLPRRPGSGADGSVPALRVSTGHRGERPVTREVLGLAAEADLRAVPEAIRAISPGTTSSRVLVLPADGPHRVLLEIDRGSALVRLQQRVDGEPVPLPRPSAPALDLGPLVDEIGAMRMSPAALPAVASPAARPQRFGTLLLDARVGSDSLDGVDDPRPRLTSKLRLGWTRELAARRLWLMVLPELRLREDAAPGGGGTLAVQLLFPRLGLRSRLAGEALAQTFAGDKAVGLRGSLRIDRPVWVAPRVQLLPSIDLGLRWQSLAAVAPERLGELHPLVYHPYTASHPFALRPGLEVRWQWLQDARLYANADVVANSDVRSLDQVNLRGGIVAVPALLRRVVPEFAVEYEGSLRLRDADRLATYMQHRVRADLGVGVWGGRAARVVFGASDSLIASSQYPLRNMFELWLRIDFVFGRGLRDYGPFDMAFRPIRTPRLWIDPEVTP